MKGEIFREEGIVLRVDGDTAEVRLVSSDHREACGAKELCSTGSDDDVRSLTAVALPGLLPGDRVQVEVSGGSLLLASGLLYGVPLLLLVAGILAGSHHSRWYPKIQYLAMYTRPRSIIHLLTNLLLDHLSLI